MEVSHTGFDYDKYGSSYSQSRKPDERISAKVNEALGSAKSVLNVGAGSGSYEPTDRYVVAIEPSIEMRKQRSSHLAPAIAGSAEDIPYDDNSFDASMAMLTIHHWASLKKGLEELRRVTRGPVVLLTFDPFAETEFWLYKYLPEMLAVDRKRYPKIEDISEFLGGSVRMNKIDVALDCTDKFQVALYARPEEFIKGHVRKSQSAWAHLPAGCEERFVKELKDDLDCGKWDERFGRFRTKSEIRCQLRLMVGT